MVRRVSGAYDMPGVWFERMEDVMEEGMEERRVGVTGTELMTTFGTLNLV